MTDKREIPIRRTDKEKVQVGDLYDGIKRYYDQNMEMTVIKLITGDCYWTSAKREMIVTILGSCISVCLYDPKLKIGGMNHILLPYGDDDNKQGNTRFGSYAMEELINGLLKIGARKNKLKAKIFGGSDIMKNSSRIGDKNVKFAKEYLSNEGIELVSFDVGGDDARRLHFFPDTGKAMIRKLRRKEDMVIIEKENEYKNILVHKVKEESKASVDLF